MNKVFFSENGLTSTSSNHICNIAKEYIQTKQKRLKDISFVNTNLKVIGSNDTTPIEYGVNSIDWIEDTLDEISRVNSLVAWLREAIKEKENASKEACSYSFEKYCADNDIELPEVEHLHVLTEAEYYNSLPIKERNRYYQLETQAAMIGKFIHPDGSLAEAREDLKDRLNKPVKVDKNGRDTLIYNYSPSLDIEEVDELFFVLQNKHRSIQAQLNQMKHDCDQAIEESKIQSDLAYKESYVKHYEAYNKVHADYVIYYNNKLKEIKKLKIAIPDSLRETYEMLSKIGK